MTSVSREKASFDPLFNPGALASSQDDVAVVPQPTPSPPSVTMTLDEFLDGSSTKSKTQGKQPPAPQKPKSLFGDDDIEDDFTVKPVAIAYRDNSSPKASDSSPSSTTTATTAKQSLSDEIDPLRAPVQAPKPTEAPISTEIAKSEKQEEKKETPAEQEKPVEEEEVIDFGAKNEDDGEDLIANVGNLKISGQAAQAKRPVLFDDEDESDLPRNDLTGVFIPNESIEKRVQITADATDKSLLDIDSEDALSRFISPAASSSSSSSSAIFSSAPSSQAKAASTTKEDDLDEDLFSFGGPSKSSTGAAAFGGDINQFDFNAYISQAQSKNSDDDLFA